MSHIWVPKFKIRECEIITPKPRLAGFFKIEAFKPGQYRRVLADWFPNLILDAGLNRMGTGTWLSAVQVGTDNTPPSISDTGLFGYVAGSSTTQSTSSGVSGSAPWYGFVGRTYRFGAGDAAGNLAEVGAGWATSGASLFSRALIVDQFGSPTTITVLGDEYLDVSYQIRLYSPNVDSTYSISISGSPYDLTTRASVASSSSYWTPGVGLVDDNPVYSLNSFAAWDGALGTVTQLPSGTNVSDSLNLSPLSYSNNSFQKDFTVVVGLNDGNGTGFINTTLVQTTIGAFQNFYDPDIPKDSSSVLTLNYRVSWARYTPTSP